MESTTLDVGDALPSVNIYLNNEYVDLQQYFTNKIGILIGISGAFVPVCHKKILPEFRSAASSIKEIVDFIGCVSVNDPYVLKGWGSCLKITNEIVFLSDIDASFTTNIGLTVDLSKIHLGLQPRSRTYAAIIGCGAEVLSIIFDEDVCAGNVMRKLDELQLGSLTPNGGPGCVIVHNQQKDMVLGHQNLLKAFTDCARIKGCCPVTDDSNPLCSARFTIRSPVEMWQSDSYNPWSFIFHDKNQLIVRIKPLRTAGVLFYNEETFSLKSVHFFYPALHNIGVESKYDGVQVVMNFYKSGAVMEFTGQERQNSNAATTVSSRDGTVKDDLVKRSIGRIKEDVEDPITAKGHSVGTRTNSVYVSYIFYPTEDEPNILFDIINHPPVKSSAITKVQKSDGFQFLRQLEYMWHCPHPYFAFNGCRVTFPYSEDVIWFVSSSMDYTIGRSQIECIRSYFGDGKNAKCVRRLNEVITMIDCIVESTT